MENLHAGISDDFLTKQQVLQATAEIFNPLGYLSPLSVRTKRPFQNLWENGVTWDCPLTDEITKEWKVWIEELTDLKRF